MNAAKPPSKNSFAAWYVPLNSTCLFYVFDDYYCPPGPVPVPFLPQRFHSRSTRTCAVRPVSIPGGSLFNFQGQIEGQKTASLLTPKKSASRKAVLWKKVKKAVRWGFAFDGIWLRFICKDVETERLWFLWTWSYQADRIMLTANFYWDGDRVGRMNWTITYIMRTEKNENRGRNHNQQRKNPKRDREPDEFREVCRLFTFCSIKIRGGWLLTMYF